MENTNILRSSEEQKTMIRDWIRALRSGDFDQGTESLYSKSANTYCCLGVLARSAGEHIYPPDDIESGHYLNEFFEPYLGDIKDKFFDYLCDEEFDLNVALNTDAEGDILIGLSALNDDRGFTFCEIADVIEHNLNNHWFDDENDEKNEKENN